MVVVSVSYPVTEGSHFNLDYYTQTHTPMLRARWDGMGLETVRLIRGTGGLGGPLGFHMIALLYFRSQADLDGALQAHGREITGDIENFTDVHPVIQLNEELA
jgi:uncharacterized protein (TIGR02118 family)